MGSVTASLTLGELFTAFDWPSQACPEDIVQDALIKRVIKFQLSWVFQVSPPLKVLNKAIEAWLPYTNITYLPQTQIQPYHTHVGNMYTSLTDTFSDKTYLVAVKADDTDVPIHMWNDRIWVKNLHSSPRQDQFVHRYSRCPLRWFIVVLEDAHSEESSPLPSSVI